MDSYTPSFWLSLAVFAWNLMLTAAVFLRKPGEQATSALAAFKEEHDKERAAAAAALAQAVSDVRLLEERVKHLPTHTDMRMLIDGLSDMRGKLLAVSESVAGQKHTLQLIQEFMSRERSGQ